MMTFCAICVFGQKQDSIVRELEYDGGKYTGEVRNGKPHGKGRILYASDDPVRLGYDGNWVNGKRHGKGIMLWRNHDAYTGNWKDGLEDGEGTCDYFNGNKYVGRWKEGAENGKGTCYYANGDKYVGNWENGLWNGKGCLHTHYGHEYCGTWKSKVIFEGIVTIECTNDDGLTIFSIDEVCHPNNNVGEHELEKAIMAKFRKYINTYNKTN